MKKIRKIRILDLCCRPTPVSTAHCTTRIHGSLTRPVCLRAVITAVITVSAESNTVTRRKHFTRKKAIRLQTANSHPPTSGKFDL